LPRALKGNLSVYLKEYFVAVQMLLLPKPTTFKCLMPSNRLFYEKFLVLGLPQDNDIQVRDQWRIGLGAPGCPVLRGK